MHQYVLPLLAVLVSGLIALPAQADILLPGGCRMGECWENRFLSKELLRETSRGRLYLVEVDTRFWPMNSEPSNNWEPPWTAYVYCSTSRPAFISQGDTGEYYASLLNPGGDPFGYEMSSYPVYWAACHNFVGPDFFSEEMTARAIRLGYPLNLEANQIELRNVLEIME